jgi:hypothetical protein
VELPLRLTALSVLPSQGMPVKGAARYQRYLPCAQRVRFVPRSSGLKTLPLEVTYDKAPTLKGPSVVGRLVTGDGGPGLQPGRGVIPSGMAACSQGEALSLPLRNGRFSLARHAFLLVTQPW